MEEHVLPQLAAFGASGAERVSATDLPRAVLSERLQEAMAGKRLRAAVFLTFDLEPDFFEQDVLPVFVLDAASHVSVIRSLQLEAALTELGAPVAVYYDRVGLKAHGASPRLGLHYVPTSRPRGYVFHPKNIFLLIDDAEPDDEARRQRSLLTVTLSANLTRAGWWESVECAHVEAVGEGKACSYRDQLLRLFSAVRAASLGGTTHTALEAVRKFVVQLGPRVHTTVDGHLLPQFFAGDEPFVDFLLGTAGGDLDGLCLEVISPFLPKEGLGPLQAIVEPFTPRAVRVFLPRDRDGAAGCSEAQYRGLSQIGTAEWGRLPQEVLKSGKAADAAPRYVHAKVYRFFHPSRKLEFVFVGSVNLTDAAQRGSGNLESGILLQLEPSRVSDWWLLPDRARPGEFRPPENPASNRGTLVPLCIRFDWGTREASACWDNDGPMPTVEVSSTALRLLSVASGEPRTWRALDTRSAEILGRELVNSVYVRASAEGYEETWLLVEEVGAASRPSLLQTLPAEDVLRYWSLLDESQRAAFLEEHGPQLIREVAQELGLDLTPVAKGEESIFTTFAGIFHGFGQLEKTVHTALNEDRVQVANYRMLGRKFDSLPYLVDKVLAGDGGDAVRRYVMLLCARQTVDGIALRHRGWAQKHHPELKALRATLRGVEAVRREVAVGAGDSESAAFLAWFEREFLRRAGKVKR
jgi:hypothetical protein